MNYTTKIGGEVRPVNTLLHLVVRDDSHGYQSGTIAEGDTARGSKPNIPPDEAHAREIAAQAVRWLSLATERTKMRPDTLTRKVIESACFSTLRGAASLAIPTKLAGVRAHQRTLWGLVRNRLPAWTLLDLNAADNGIEVSVGGDVIGRIQPKHHGWLKPLIPFGVRLYLSRITGHERSGYTLGVNVVVGHVGSALDCLLAALGEAGFNGDGYSGPETTEVDVAVTRATPTGSAIVWVYPESDALGGDAEDIVMWRGQRGIAQASVMHIIRHSPTGVEWGYRGSGPSDLARSVLLSFTSEAEANALYTDFRDAVISAIPEAGGMLRAGEVRQWIAAHTESGGDGAA